MAADRTRKDESTPKDKTRELRDLTPRKDPKGGIFGPMRKPAPPTTPGRLISSPATEPTQRDR